MEVLQAIPHILRMKIWNKKWDQRVNMIFTTKIFHIFYYF
jgi:hypothetical protein